MKEYLKQELKMSQGNFLLMSPEPQEMPDILYANQTFEREYYPVKEQRILYLRCQLQELVEYDIACEIKSNPVTIMKKL